MSDPRRWRDDDCSPAEVRELLQRVKGVGGTRPLPPASRARSAARLDRMLAIPAAAGMLLWLKGVAVAAGIGVLGVVAVKHLPALVSGGAETGTPPAAAAPARAFPAARPTSVPPTAMASAAEPLATTVPTVAIPVASTTPQLVAPVTPSAPSQSASTAEADSLASEAAMLDRARGLLASDPAAALRVLDAYTAAFPAGHLGLERELLAVEVLRRMGRFGEARARGESLLAQAPGSLYEARVRAILDSMPATP